MRITDTHARVLPLDIFQCWHYLAISSVSQRRARLHLASGDMLSRIASTTLVTRAPTMKDDRIPLFEMGFLRYVCEEGGREDEGDGRADVSLDHYIATTWHMCRGQQCQPREQPQG